MTPASFDEIVLLTGFPGFAARKMLEELLGGSRRTFVHALVRPRDAGDARAARDALSAEPRARVSLLEGDPAAMDLGLSGAEWKQLGLEITHIHAMAQAPLEGEERETAERVNVGGAREILELARACRRLERLVFHSTAHVAGDRTGIVLEEELDKGQAFRNPGEETLARAEKMVRAAMSKVPACVVRPTIMIGDSRTGEVDPASGPYFLILLVVGAPPDFPLVLPGRADASLHLAPVDYVVRAAAAIGRDPRARGRTFHLGDPSPLPARRVFDLIAAAGGRRGTPGFVPANLTKALLRTPGLERVARSPRTFLDALTTRVSYSFANTTALLGDELVRCPPFESYVELLVEHVQRRLRERRSRDFEIEEPPG